MENIIINFTADPSGLQPGIEGLVQLGEIDKENADQAKKTMDAFQKRDKAVTDGTKTASTSLDKLSAGFKNLDKSIVGGNYQKALKGLEKALEGTSDEFKQLALVIEFTKQQLKDLDPNSQAFKDLSKELEVAEEIMKTFGAETEKTVEKSKSMKARLRELKEELAQMETAGQEGSAAFQKLAVEAAKLEDQIGDTSERVRAMASDTRHIDAVVEAVGLISTGFQAATAATALFGEESEDMQKALVKLNAIMALTNSIQQVQNFLRGQSILKLKLEAAGQAVLAASTRLTAGAFSAFGFSVAATSTAFKILRTAIISTGIGALVVGIGFLVDKLLSLTSSADSAASAMGNLTAAIESQNLALENNLADLDEFGKTRIAKLKEQGASEDKIHDETIFQYRRMAIAYRESVADRLEQLKKYQDGQSNEITNSTQAAQQLIEIERELSGEVEESRKGILESRKAVLQGIVTDLKGAEDAYRSIRLANGEFSADQAQQRRDDAKKAEDDAEKEAEKRRDRILRNSKAELELLRIEKEKQIAFLKTISETEGVPVTDRSKSLRDALLLEQEIIIAQRDLELNNEELTANERKLIHQQADDAILAKRTEYGTLIIQLHQKIADDIKAIEQGAANLQASEVQKNIDRLQGILKANKDFTLPEQEVEQDNNLENYSKGLIDREQYEKNKQDITNKYNRKNLEYDKKYFEDLLLTGGLTNDQREAAEKGLFDTKKQLREADIRDAEEKAAEELAIEAEKTAIQMQLIQAAYNLAQQLSDTLFANQEQRRNYQLNKQLEDLKKKKDRELANEALTEDQREQIVKKYQLRENELKKKAFEDDKRAKKAQAAINGALAITNILATRPKFDLGIGDAIMIAAAIASTAAQIAAIENTQIPGFKKGTRKAPAGLKWVGEEGPELINDKGGYSIMPARDSQKFALSNFTDTDIAKKWNMPTASYAQMPEFSQEKQQQIAQYFQNSSEIDYDRLAGIIAEKMGSITSAMTDQLKEVPAPSLSIDERGFTAALKKNYEEIEFINKKLTL